MKQFLIISFVFIMFVLVFLASGIGEAKYFNPRTLELKTVSAFFIRGRDKPVLVWSEKNIGSPNVFGSIRKDWALSSSTMPNKWYLSQYSYLASGGITTKYYNFYDVKSYPQYDFKSSQTIKEKINSLEAEYNKNL